MSHPVTACPHCAADHELPLVCTRCGWRWHANPRPTAAVLLERGSAGDRETSVLLLRRAVDPGRGAWDLPAGYLDPGESFEAGARREAREEAGMEVELLELAGVYHSPAANAVSVVYRARALEAGAPVLTDDESSDHAWVRRSDVERWIGLMAFPSMAAALQDWSRSRVGPPTVSEPERLR